MKLTAIFYLCELGIEKNRLIEKLIVLNKTRMVKISFKIDVRTGLACHYPSTVLWNGWKVTEALYFKVNQLFYTCSTTTGPKNTMQTTCKTQLAGHTSMQSNATTDAWEEKWHTSCCFFSIFYKGNVMNKIAKWISNITQNTGIG